MSATDIVQCRSVIPVDTYDLLREPADVLIELLDGLKQKVEHLMEEDHLMIDSPGMVFEFMCVAYVREQDTDEIEPVDG